MYALCCSLSLTRSATSRKSCGVSLWPRCNQHRKRVLSTLTSTQRNLHYSSFTLAIGQKHGCDMHTAEYKTQKTLHCSSGGNTHTTCELRESMRTSHHLWYIPNVFTFKKEVSAAASTQS